MGDTGPEDSDPTNVGGTRSEDEAGRPGSGVGAGRSGPATGEVDREGSATGGMDGAGAPSSRARPSPCLSADDTGWDDSG